MSTSEQASQEASSTQKLIRAKIDLAWAHCKQIIETGKKPTLMCLYCDKIVRGGGINRFKYHLAGEKGQVEECKKVSADIRYQMRESINGVKSKKRKAEDDYYEDSNPTQESVMHAVSEKGGKNIPNISNYFMPRTVSGGQPTIKSVMQSKEVIEKCDIAIAKWMIDASVPFNAVNSQYYQPMIDAIASMGAGYKGPNFYKVRGHLLNTCVADVKKLVDGYRSIWKETGCTLMADGWTDRCRRTLISFLVYCPKGTVFLKSVDASNASKTADLLYKLFKEVILYIGAENIVHIVTDNAANYVAAGRLLEAEFPRLFWSPCGAHCINLMFQDIRKIEEVNEAVSHASKITKYIYNHCYALHLMRQHTGGKDILRPAVTRFATNFIALESVLSQKQGLRAMVTSREWTISAYAKESKAKRFVDLVLDSAYWDKCAEIVKITEPLVRLLRVVDSEHKPAMGFLYKVVYDAKEQMVSRFKRNTKKVEPYLAILDKRWDLQLRKNLHAAGFWLNPAIRFNDVLFEKHGGKTTSGFLDAIERYANGDCELLSKLTNEMRLFRNAEGDFGRKAAVQDRNTVLPDQWWETYGCDAPNLQKLAIRILSQTCSSSGCERNWSVFEHIHSKKRNRLEHQKLNDLVYVRYNLRLHKRKPLKFQNFDPINFETCDEHSEWVLEESPPYLTNVEVESLRNELGDMTIDHISDDIVQINLDEDEDEDVEEYGHGQGNENEVNELNEDPSKDAEDVAFFDDLSFV